MISKIAYSLTTIYLGGYLSFLTLKLFNSITGIRLPMFIVLIIMLFFLRL